MPVTFDTTIDAGEEKSEATSTRYSSRFSAESTGARARRDIVAANAPLGAFAAGLSSSKVPVSVAKSMVACESPTSFADD